MRNRNVAVTGATGLLGPYVVAALERAGANVVAWGGASRPGGVDLEDASSIERALAGAKPNAVVHVAALSAIADCARDPDRARRINVDGTRALARAAETHGARFVHVSTDLVFDGEGAPYAEEAPASPLSVYGTTKRDAELAALSIEDAVVVRVSLLFGPSRSSRIGFFDQQLAALRQGKPLALFDDEWRTPLSLRAAADGLTALAASSFRGVVHLGGPERMSRAEMGERLAKVAGVTPNIARGSRSAVPGEPRPRDVSLDSSLFTRLFPDVGPRRSFDEECAQMLADRGSA